MAVTIAIGSKNVSTKVSDTILKRKTARRPNTHFRHTIVTRCVCNTLSIPYGLYEQLTCENRYEFDQCFYRTYVSYILLLK